LAGTKQSLFPWPVSSPAMFCRNKHWEIATKTLLMFFLNKKHLHPGFSRNDDAAFVHYWEGYPLLAGSSASVHLFTNRFKNLSPWLVSSPAMLCRNKNIRCNVIANRLSQSSSFPRMLKGDKEVQ
jgi:hypothetical protein